MRSEFYDHGRALSMLCLGRAKFHPRRRSLRAPSRTIDAASTLGVGSLRREPRARPGRAPRHRRRICGASEPPPEFVDPC